MRFFSNLTISAQKRLLDSDQIVGTEKGSGKAPTPRYKLNIISEGISQGICHILSILFDIFNKSILLESNGVKISTSSYQLLVVSLDLGTFGGSLIFVTEMVAAPFLFLILCF